MVRDTRMGFNCFPYIASKLFRSYRSGFDGSRYGRVRSVMVLRTREIEYLRYYARIDICLSGII